MFNVQLLRTLNFQFCKSNGPELINSFKGIFKDLNWLNPFIIILWDTLWALKQPTSWKWFKYQTGHSLEGLSLNRHFCPSKMKNSVFFPFTPHFLHFYLLLFGLILSKYSIFILCSKPLKREEKKKQQNNPHIVLEITVSFKHKLGSRNSTWKKNT